MQQFIIDKTLRASEFVSVVAKNDITKIDSTNKTLELRIIGWDMSPLINYYQQ